MLMTNALLPRFERASRIVSQLTQIPTLQAPSKKRTSATLGMPF